MARPSSRSGFTRSLGGMKYPGESEHARLKCRGLDSTRARKPTKSRTLRVPMPQCQPEIVVSRARVAGHGRDVRAQVAVFAGAFGFAASAFSRARFSSHSAFFLARRSRLRRAVRGSCGLSLVVAVFRRRLWGSRD